MVQETRLSLFCPSWAGRGAWSCKLGKVVERKEKAGDPNAVIHILDNYPLDIKIANVIDQSTNTSIVEDTTEKYGTKGAHLELNVWLERCY